jgi:hypothetical protein
LSGLDASSRASLRIRLVEAAWFTETWHSCCGSRPRYWSLLLSCHTRFCWGSGRGRQGWRGQGRCGHGERRPHGPVGSDVADLVHFLGDDPRTYTARGLRDFVEQRCRHYRCNSSRMVLAAVPMFLRYLAVEGHCRPGLEHALIPLANWAQPALPRGLTPEQIRRVLALCPSTPRGLRDRAVLLLCGRSRRVERPPCVTGSDPPDDRGRGRRHKERFGDIGESSPRPLVTPPYAISAVTPSPTSAVDRASPANSGVACRVSVRADVRTSLNGACSADQVR